MKKYLPLLLILFTLLSCKTTPEDYSNYTFIDQGIKSDKYEIITIFSKENELTTIFGHRYPEDSRSKHFEEINQMPLIVYDKSNSLYFRYINNEKNYDIHDFKYTMINNTLDTLSVENMNIIRNSYSKKENKFIDFKFPQAQKYYKVIEEKYHSEISEEKKNRILEEYKDSSEEIKQDIVQTFSLRYYTIYSELQMPKEKIKFKFNSYENKKIEFFGNEDLYKKGYMYIYIYDNLDMFPHSGGLYVICPKAIK